MTAVARLRPIERADLATILVWRNHESIRHFMFDPHIISPGEHLNWFEKCANDSSRHPLMFEIEGQPAGYTFFKVDLSNQIADWGFYAAPGSAKGTGTLMGECALRYAFEELGLHKVCGLVLRSNLASLRMHEKLGFVPEGILRKQQLIAGQYHDLVCYGIIAQEWSGREGS